METKCYMHRNKPVEQTLFNVSAAADIGISVEVSLRSTSSCADFEDFLADSRVQYSLPYEATLVVIEDLLGQSCADELMCVVWTVLEIELLVLSVPCTYYHVPDRCLRLAE